MRPIAIAFIALLVGLGGIASAQGPGSYVQRASPPYGGAATLHAYYVAPDACQAALSGKRGAPPGQTVPRNTIPVTIVIGPNPKGCGNDRLVTRLVNVSGPATDAVVQIFFVNTSGRILKIEKVEMPPT